ncbi:MAG: ATP-binding cassette domain-containing protein, partial [Actinomycetota bacterium]|nr:ATP-binding cassette domain-containing protein [Actinomycetota bacterium]
MITGRAAAASAAPVVTATGLHIGYGATPVLADTNISVDVGAELAVTGRSGSGKTTLLLVLAGLLPPQQGTVR